MTYEPLERRRINGMRTPWPTTHLWPIGLGLSARPPAGHYTTGYAKP
jgi:hypothetical protein